MTPGSKIKSEGCGGTRESLREFISRQQTFVEFQLPLEAARAAAAVTSRENDGLKKISDKAASFFPSPLCLDDPSLAFLRGPPSIHLSPYPIWHGYACQEKKPLLLSSPPLPASACLSNVQKCQKLPDKARKKKCREGNGAIDPPSLRSGLSTGLG